MQGPIMGRTWGGGEVLVAWLDFMLSIIGLESGLDNAMSYTYYYCTVVSSKKTSSCRRQYRLMTLCKEGHSAVQRRHIVLYW
jgi:hypothetical protein